ncbi:PAS domain-containing protein [Mesorhizobium xinjiangense]|uniref:PAS domain-containing protein n=1 Tax=Mesorhizobium xinjiangense TaxID=2678685 RepID=UPI0012ED6F52|nr:PAS domain-containing protein [Mesorhizobium xinjiangense]
MKHQGTVALFQYWDRLRQGRPAPQRTQIEPAAIKAQLADTFILEQDLRGEAVFRLAGTRLCATLGRELKGFSFASLWAAPDQGMITSLTDAALTSNSVSVLTYDGLTRHGRKLGFELILLPLDGKGQDGRILGVATPAEKTVWLGAEPIVENRINAMRFIDPERERHFLGSRPALAVPPLVPSDSSLGAAATDGTRRIRHLVVLEGGREPE